MVNFQPIPMTMKSPITIRFWTKDGMDNFVTYLYNISNNKRGVQESDCTMVILQQSMKWKQRFTCEIRLSKKAQL